MWNVQIKTVNYDTILLSCQPHSSGHFFGRALYMLKLYRLRFVHLIGALPLPDLNSHYYVEYYKVSNWNQGAFIEVYAFISAGPAQSGILSDREVVNLFLHFTVNPKPRVDYIDRPRCCLRGKECCINRFQQVESRWGYSGTSDRIRYLAECGSAVGWGGFHPHVVGGN